MLKVLITGISGFVGSHFADFLLEQGQEVYGTIRPRSKMDNIKHLEGKIKLYDCNILDTVSVMNTVKEIKPDIISHLAAQSFVPTSWKSPQDTLQTNIIGTVNILEAVREYCPECIVHIAGSSEEYGMVYESELPIKETNPLRPLSPYGVSKVAQDLLGQQYHKSYGLKVIISRAFNHEGARRGEVFVTSDFARQVIEVKIGKREVIEVGNLDAIRDFTNVKDVVRGYKLVIDKGLGGEVYNICSGIGVSIRELLELFIEAGGLGNNIFMKQIDSKMRPSDVPILVGDNTKIKALGWEPKIPLNETIKEILNYWRERK